MSRPPPLALMAAPADAAVGFAVRLGRGPGQIATARVVTRRALEVTGHAGDPEFLDDVLLIVSELVTNALRHTGERPLLVLRAQDGRVRVDVRDGDPRLPVRRLPEPGEPGGRGLRLVSALADRYGAHPLPDGGKTVWAVVGHRRPERRARRPQALDREP
ncbi:ATP-binding protein [Kitasatospora sp. NPDC001539]|uniref:ATP-binding protein n=1 Tax=unclassified Kitasatospora TaxID=2633591 RepID=UPI00332A4320